MASQEFEKARRLALRLLEMHPEDYRLHDIVVSTALASLEKAKERVGALSKIAGAIQDLAQERAK